MKMRWRNFRISIGSKLGSSEMYLASPSWENCQMCSRISRGNRTGNAFSRGRKKWLTISTLKDRSSQMKSLTSSTPSLCKIEKKYFFDFEVSISFVWLISFQLSRTFSSWQIASKISSSLTSRRLEDRVLWDQFNRLWRERIRRPINEIRCKWRFSKKKKKKWVEKAIFEKLLTTSMLNLF